MEGFRIGDGRNRIGILFGAGNIGKRFDQQPHLFLIRVGREAKMAGLAAELPGYAAEISHGRPTGIDEIDVGPKVGMDVRSLAGMLQIGDPIIESLAALRVVSLAPLVKQGDGALERIDMRRMRSRAISPFGQEDDGRRPTRRVESAWAGPGRRASYLRRRSPGHGHLVIRRRYGACELAA